MTSINLTNQDSLKADIQKKMKPHIKSLVKEAFNSFADDYQIKLSAIKTEISRPQKSQEYLADKYDKLQKEYENLNKCKDNNKQKNILLT